MAALASDLTTNQNAPADLWSAAASALKSQANAAPIVRVGRTGELPLSHSQERLYFLMQSGQNGPHYQVHLAWRVSGELKSSVLERSIRAIAQRHEILRTTFPVRDGRPVAVILPEAHVTFRVVDLEALDLAERENEALRLANEEVRRPFDLSAGPLIRAALFRIDFLRHLLVVTVCQIAFDGWSMRVFSRELRERYAAFAADGRSSPPPLPVQWADFVDWQRNMIEGPSIETDRDYWRTQLEAPYVALRLPVDQPRSGTRIPSGVKRPWSLSKGLTEALNGLARQEGVTHFTALLAALQAWLCRLTGQQDVIVFASTFARSQPETRALIGPFANVLPLRTGLSGDPTFREVLRRASTASLGGFAHPSLPFESMLEMLPVSSSHADLLFQVMLVHQNAPLPVLAAGEVTFTPTHELHTGTAIFDFLWDVAETAAGLKGTFTYRSDLFNANAIQTLLADFETFVEDAVTASDRPVSQLRPVPTKAHAPVRPGPEIDVENRVFLAPRDRLEQQLAAVWEKVFERAPIGIRDDFFSLGGGSLLAVRLLAETERTTGERLPMSALLGAPTIEKLAELLRQDGWKPQYSSLVPIRRTGSKPPIYCISGAGGSVLVFHSLARHLSADQPVYGLEPPLPDGKQSVLASVEEIAAHYIQEVRAIQPEGPYYLVGFSFGGLVAFEMAQQFHAQGDIVALLAFFDSSQDSCARELTAAARFREKLRVYRQHARGVFAGPRRLRRFGKLVRGKSLKMMYWACQFFGRPVPSTLAAAGTIEDVQVFARMRYLPRVYPGRVTLFRARIRPGFERLDYQLGWGQLAGAGVEVHDVPGDHHSMVTEPNVRVLAESFKVRLEKAQMENERKGTLCPI